MLISAIKENFRGFFSELNTMAKKRPLVTIIYALALTVLSGFIAEFSLLLAIGVFSVSIPFHLVVIKNFKGIYKNFETKAKDFFTGDPKEKGKDLGHNLKIVILQVYNRTIGFFEGLFSKKKGFVK
ncbi:MAG: hypothetical protein K1060chlam1_00452 [Candidatus Anoxychlamydiales bacterium]|nr:hypothetical protein [Candidatus Anoxychlamydiales bacterium]